MFEWLHICNDVDNGQNVENTTTIFCGCLGHQGPRDWGVKDSKLKLTIKALRPQK